MPRKPRINAPGAIYHLISRGNDKQAIFRDNEDYLKFISLLGQTKKMAPFRLYAHSLMPNHFHLLVQTIVQPTAVFMQRLLTCYSQHFNHRHGHIGHVFQDRYKALPCARDSYFHSLIKYIHNNPVRAGLVSRPESWPWSGYNELLGHPGWGLIDQPSGLLMFDDQGQSSQYLEEVEFPSNIFDEDSKPEGRRRMLEQLAQVAAEQSGVSTGMLRGPRRLRRLTPARRLFASLATSNGYRAEEIASFLNRAKSSVFELRRQSSQ